MYRIDQSLGLFVMTMDTSHHSGLNGTKAPEVSHFVIILRPLLYGQAVNTARFLWPVGDQVTGSSTSVCKFVDELIQK